MPERTEWAIRVVPVNRMVFEGELMYFADWEPLIVRNGYIWLKKQVMIEDEKSSVHHELTFSQRYGDPED